MRKRSSTPRRPAHREARVTPIPGEPHPFSASVQSRELSEFEFALIILMFGFQRWVVNCMEAARYRGLSALDILVLHAVNHRARGRRLAEICMVLNIDDTHLVAYALKKLVAADLVEVAARGRERHYESTPAGDDACMEYRRVRETILIPALSWLSSERSVVRDAGAFMRTMTAIYEQAGRFATAQSAAVPATPLHTKR